jgi:hypothetical protein
MKNNEYETKTRTGRQGTLKNARRNRSKSAIFDFNRGVSQRAERPPTLFPRIQAISITTASTACERHCAVDLTSYRSAGGSWSMTAEKRRDPSFLPDLPRFELTTEK